MMPGTDVDPTQEIKVILPEGMAVALSVEAGDIIRLVNKRGSIKMILRC